MTDLRTSLRRFNVSAFAYAASVTALGHALQYSSGTYDGRALRWMVLAFCLCGLATLLHRWSGAWSHAGIAATALLLTAGIFWNIWQHEWAVPAAELDEHTRLLPFKVGMFAQGLLVLLGLSGWRATRRLWFPLILFVNLMLGVWLLRASPNPHIDVVTVHHEAIDALLRQADPYRISFPNIYGADSSKYYNPAVVFGNRIGFGYPYPPPSLILAVPGQVLFGDYRYSELACLLIAAGLIGYSRTHIAAPLAAVALLTTPRGFFVLEQGWTEPITVLLVALTTFLLMRGPVRASLAAGLMLATKQYLPFTGLAVLRTLLLDRTHWKRAVFLMVLTGAACILPFALWHPNAFMRSVVWLQTQEPFRTDSLSFLNWADRNGWGRGSFLWAVGAAVVASLLTLATTRNTPSGFAASTAMVMFAMFAFGSKAFCNYYYFVIGAMCIAVAAFAGPDEEDVTLGPGLPLASLAEQGRDPLFGRGVGTEERAETGR